MPLFVQANLSQPWKPTFKLHFETTTTIYYSYKQKNIQGGDFVWIPLENIILSTY